MLSRKDWILLSMGRQPILQKLGERSSISKKEKLRRFLQI